VDLLATTLFCRLPAKIGRRQAVGSLRRGKDDSDVAFYGSDLLMINTGAMHRFGAG
jgi:hypothetical protein